MGSNTEYCKIVWHSLENDEVLSILKTNAVKGLSSEEAEKRLIEFGKNTLPESQRRSLLTIIAHQFLSPLVYLLLVASGISFFIGENRDGIVILVIVFLNAIISTFQEGRAEKSLLSLRRLYKMKARVIRDGKEKIIESDTIVPGDIILLDSGDAIAADTKLIKSSSMSVAEAALTGESFPVMKSVAILKANTPLADRSNMVYAGTHVTRGKGAGVVMATGISSEIGKIAQLATSTIEPKTQLELRVALYGKYLAIGAFFIFCLAIGIGLLKKISFTEIFMVAIGQMVSVVPEGLPMAMTIALAVGVQRMAKRGTIVRRLGAVETLGATTVICTDKTGTLTKNEMTVNTLYLPIGKRQITVDGVGYKPAGNFIENGKIIVASDDEALEKFLEACVLCNDAKLLGPDETDSRWRIIGDPTEGALLTLAHKGGVDQSKIKNQFLRKAELPFNSDEKMMAIQYEFNERNIVFIKGAPEEILKLSTHLSKKAHSKIQHVANQMAGLGLRVLALGYLDNFTINENEKFKSFHGKVSLLGLVGELDPPREEVADSIRDCQTAGIKAVMVTGDHKLTGEAIARSLGIIKKNDLVIDGLELDQLSDLDLLEKIDRISVFARVHPAQKLRIVEAYQKKGHIVAMTGDGVNDTPALLRANVSVAMGISGTEIAKESSKIIITDDNFATIVKAIAEGRLVYENIKKLILFLLVTSFDEVIILFLALILGYHPPLTALQILWINIVTEGALTANLIMEPPEGDEMKRPPIPPDQPLLDRLLIARIPLMVLISVASTLSWFIYRSSKGISSNIVQSETFTILAMCQWFNVLNCRSRQHSVFSWGLFKNTWLFGGLFFAIVLHAMVIYLPFFNHFFKTVPIEGENLFIIVIIASAVLWIEELRKLISRKSKHLSSQQ